MEDTTKPMSKVIRIDEREFRNRQNEKAWQATKPTPGAQLSLLRKFP